MRHVRRRQRLCLADTQGFMHASVSLCDRCRLARNALAASFAALVLTDANIEDASIEDASIEDASIEDACAAVYIVLCASIAGVTAKPCMEP